MIVIIEDRKSKLLKDNYFKTCTCDLEDLDAYLPMSNVNHDWNRPYTILWNRLCCKDL